MAPTLYLVPTPVGNLEDMTLRAIRVLKEVGLIFAEDTRSSGVLLKHFEIETRMMAYHKFNEHQKLESYCDLIRSHGSCALITDAGTPAISDPGFLLVRACIDQGIRVECLPGATAFVPALVNSGLPCEKFVFEGFLPVKKGRKTRLDILATEARTMVFYESPHRILKTLEQLVEVMGKERKASVSREISKKFEEVLHGSLAELGEHFKTHKAKGEFVLVVEGLKD